MSIRVEGGNALGELAAALRSAGQGGLIRELGSELHQEAEPIPAAVKATARSTLPKSGGFAGLVAESRMGVTVQTSTREAKVTVAAVSGMDLPRIDQGRVRHPVFGNRKKWETQHVTPGFFTKTVMARAAGFRRAAERTVQRFADKIK